MSAAMNERHSHAPAGHLARLVERVAPGEPILRRRRPALFEGAAAAAADEPVDVADESVALRRGAPERGGVATPVPQRAPVLRTPSEPAPAAYEHPAASHAPPRIDATIRATALPPPGRSLPTPPAAAPAGAPPSLTRAAPPPRVAAPTEALRRSDNPAPAPVSTPARHAERTAAPPLPAALPRLAATQAVQAALPLLPARPVPPPRVAGRCDLPAPQRSAAAAPLPALPPIEVTIGRIEVRATNSAPPASRHRGTTPRLGLDQYLRERGDSR